MDKFIVLWYNYSAKRGIFMEFELKDEYITLAQLLKACDVVYSGGQAKEYLANMEVFVNGVNENRRGKKIYRGDVVETNGIRIEVK